MKIKLKVNIYDKTFHTLCDIMQERKRGNVFERDTYYWEMIIRGVC